MLGPIEKPAAAVGEAEAAQAEGLGPVLLSIINNDIVNLL